MQSLTEKVFRLAPPYGLFDGTVVGNLFPGETEGARKLLVYRAVRAGEVLRLKPGLYLLAREYRKSDPHPFVLAASLHFPSHVSLESALSYHGLIPEAVHGVSCVTLSRGRTFRTPAGVFSFFRVPCKNPRAGVKALRIDKIGWAFIAEPLRAIADMVYLNRKIEWKSDGIGYLTESLRIEEDDLVSLDFSSHREILNGLVCSRTWDYLENLKKELSR
jgi:predicted transcriptional regulator of viral defense system